MLVPFGETVEKLMEGKINGKRSRGNSPTRWVDQTKEIIRHGLQEALLNAFAVQYKGRWRTTIQTIEN